MFSHIFKYRLRCYLKQKETIFWTLVFPILLSTLFSLAFSNVMEGETFDKVSVAVVNSQNAEESFLSAMENTDLFIIQKTTREEADELLSKGEISGYITCSDEIGLTVLKSGMNESIIKTFLDGYSQMSSTITNIHVNNPQGMTGEFFEILDSEGTYTKDAPISSSNNTTVIYFYTLLAMTCLLSATFGCMAVVEIQANQSQLAARMNVAPTHKLKIFAAMISAAFVHQFTSILIVLAYLKFVLKIDFGNSTGFVILLCFVSCVTGITMGSAISSIIKKSEQIKMSLIIAITMLGCFLAGMMNNSIKYTVQTKVPAIAYINPANLVTDGFYCLYYYDTYERFFLNIAILAAMSILFCAITYLVLRRQKYASV